MFNITKDNSKDLGFAINCLFSQAINIDEFNQWILYIIETSSMNEIPGFIFDLIDFNGDLFKIIEKIGFSPYSRFSKEEEEAIIGISYLRNNTLIETSVSRDSALESLNKHKNIYLWFEKLFPFIHIDYKF